MRSVAAREAKHRIGICRLRLLHACEDEVLLTRRGVNGYGATTKGGEKVLGSAATVNFTNKRDV